MAQRLQIKQVQVSRVSDLGSTSKMTLNFNFRSQAAIVAEEYTFSLFLQENGPVVSEKSKF